MNKKVIQESYYTPKLNLKFEPPITNDSFGVSKVDKILKLIDNLYPNTKWWYGGKPSEYNPFLHPIDDDDDDSGYPEEICNFIIGYRDDFPNRITYGLYCDDSYGNEIDGYKWLQDNETNYDETEGMFNQLNESVEFDLENYYQSNTLFYEVGKSGGPIKHDDIVGDDLGDLLHVGKRDGQYLICYYILVDGQKYEECVGGQKLLLKALRNREIVPVPYDEVGNPFDQLNENIDEDDVPKVTYVFEPPIEDRETLEIVLYAVGNEHPNMTWPTGEPILSYNVYREIFNDNEGYDFVGGLSIFPNESGTDFITWTSWVDSRGSYSDYGPKADGWQLLQKTTNLDTHDIFNQLNEERYQPKLNLRFEDGISDADELDEVLKVLAVVYPGLTWVGGAPITKHNVIRDEQEESSYYDPIYYLTIGFFSHKPDKLTYTSGSYRDISYADDEHDNYDWVDGYRWIRDNQINYDETDDMFQQLNEALEYDENNPLHKFDIFLDKTNTTSDIKYILDLYKESGIPSNKKDEWANHDIDYSYEWFLDPKKGGEGMIIGTGLTSKGYYIYWQGFKADTPKVRNSMGTNKELVTFDRFLELTAFDDDPFGTGFNNIFG